MTLPPGMVGKDGFNEGCQSLQWAKEWGKSGGEWGRGMGEVKDGEEVGKVRDGEEVGEVALYSHTSPPSNTSTLVT
ncbi:unnamed protein product [Linum trigynum]|uniref:Uncharacterized protein n=1 Tax=Linum trigynum TaxID=586398 RepID=A0AAV2E8M2_9ROSI